MNTWENSSWSTLGHCENTKPPSILQHRNTALQCLKQRKRWWNLNKINSSFQEYALFKEEMTWSRYHTDKNNNNNSTEIFYLFLWEKLHCGKSGERLRDDSVYRLPAASSQTWRNIFDKILYRRLRNRF